MKNIIYTILTVFIVGVSITSCTGKPHKTESHGHHEKDNHGDEHSEEVMLTAQQFESLQMKIDRITQRNMTGFVEANGTLEVPPQNEAAITTVVGANITAIEVIEGDKVSKNQIVAYLSHPNIIKVQTDYLNAYSHSNFLKKDYQRQKKLYDAGVGSGLNFQKAEAEYNASKAMVNGLEAQLKILNINPAGVRKGTIYQRIGLRSPIEGYVQKVEVKTGQYVEPQTELLEIVNTHHIHADLMVFEKDVHKVEQGQKVSFSVQSIPGKELSAEIYSVSKTFEDNPKAVHVHAEIENKKGNLIPGMYIQGKIQVDSTRTAALPKNAIIKEGDKFYVFSVEKENEDWSFKPLEIIPGVSDEDWTAVHFMSEVTPHTKLALNNAYYLIAEKNKGEAAHTH